MDLPCRKAIELIKRYEPVKGYFVSFSGGKDSVVLLDLVKRTTVRYRAFFNITTVDSPELLQFIHKYYPDVKWLKPQATMRQAIIKNQYPPTRIARYCCGCLKECHGHGRIILTGIRRAESTKRAKRKEIEVDYNDRTKIFIHPLFSWSTQQIWQYIRTNNLSYCALYDEGFKRIGCVLCPMQTTREKLRDMKRWPNFVRKYQKWFQEMLEAKKSVGKSSSWKTGQEVFEWWIENANKNISEDLFQEVSDGFTVPEKL